MAASPDQAGRRPRYTRQPREGVLSLTPERLALLQWVAELRLSTIRHLAALTGLSEKGAQRRLRILFDSGLAEIVALPRAALVGPGSGNDAGLLSGSAPNVYVITRAGIKVLRQAGWAGEAPSATHYGPRNSLFLAHELLVRDVRVWITLAARACPSSRLTMWRDGKGAEIDLRRTQAPKVVRPDAWLVCQIGDRTLVALVEVDRGTERGPRRWQEKLEACQALLEGGRLPEVTGYGNLRILTFAPDTARSERLARFIAEHAKPWLADRFWLTEWATLAQPDLTAPLWRRPGASTCVPLVPPELVVQSSNPTLLRVRHEKGEVSHEPDALRRSA